MTLALAVSTGDPGGVGPQVSVEAALARVAEQPHVLFGDADALSERARALAGERVRLRRVTATSLAEVRAGEIGLVDVGVPWTSEACSHRPTAAGGGAQLAALDAALAVVRAGAARALVTAPMSKEAVTLSGAAFVGHTEHLARSAGLSDDAVTMLFLGPRLNVALVTTHVSIRDVPSAVTTARVQRATRHMAEALLSMSSAEPHRPPRLVVAGLNPHAGEAGMFGDEERRVVAPAIEALRAEPPFCDGRVTLLGPSPAETVFREAAERVHDGVVAMFHDQATIASKLLDWGQAVNVTWGLPYVRTSVDHGVAYAAAAAGNADSAGMIAAVDMALRLTAVRREG